MKHVINLASLLIPLAVSCRGSAPKSTETAAISISGAQGREHAMLTLPLKVAPTLASIPQSRGLLKDIDDEQRSTIAALKAISGDIKIIYRYRHLWNGLYVAVPAKFASKVAAQFPQGTEATLFRAPRRAATASSKVGPIGVETSVKFIGTPTSPRGKGMKIAVIDTGIDYTHSMFGGPGTTDTYKSNDPKVVEPGSFPTQKVVGGIDLVGSNYDPDTLVAAQYIPAGDGDPLDEQGHGTHVAGTIAGVGDGVNSYDGVARDAGLWAIKIFGAAGTTDADIMAAMEYAVDPNRDGSTDDHMDAVNLSVGGVYSQPKNHLNTAITNAMSFGMILVQAAGNSGPLPFIVSPTATGLSVAASSDNSFHVWHSAQARVTLKDGTDFIAEMAEADGFPTPGGAMDGELIAILAGGSVAGVKGKLVLSPYPEDYDAKTSWVQTVAGSGAAGLILISKWDDVSAMENPVPDFPLVMLGKNEGNKILDAMGGSPAKISLNIPEMLARPEKIDLITEFSSQGPRAIDAHLKPEIAAPGLDIISAKMGSGNLGVKYSGTSMAAPHMTGAMALIKQKYPILTGEQLKSLVTTTTKVLTKADTKSPFPMTLQGAGRIQLDRALEAPLAFSDSTISLGIVEYPYAEIHKTLVITNVTQSAQTVHASGEHVAVSPPRFSLSPGASTTVELIFKSSYLTSNVGNELSGYVTFGSQQLAYYGIVKANSAISARQAPKGLKISNSSSSAGEALLFHKIGIPSRADESENPCKIEAAGYRTTTSDLYIGVVLNSPLTNWNYCIISVLIDSDLDSTTDLELVAGDNTWLENPDGDDHGEVEITSLLLDAKIMKSISKIGRRKHEYVYDYRKAIVKKWKAATAPYSGTIVLQSALADLVPINGKIRLRLASLPVSSDRFANEYYAGSPAAHDWLEIPVSAPLLDQKSTEVTLAPGGEAFVDTQGQSGLLLIYPSNPGDLRWDYK
jgi:subtilisin family serine protease